MKTNNLPELVTLTSERVKQLPIFELVHPFTGERSIGINFCYSGEGKLDLLIPLDAMNVLIERLQEARECLRGEP
jgi:hypothetical protein